MVRADPTEDTRGVVATPEPFREIVRYLPLQLGIHPLSLSEAGGREAGMRDGEDEPTFRTQNARYGAHAGGNVCYIHQRHVADHAVERGALQSAQDAGVVEQVFDS